MVKYNKNHSHNWLYQWHVQWQCPDCHMHHPIPCENPEKCGANSDHSTWQQAHDRITAAVNAAINLGDSPFPQMQDPTYGDDEWCPECGHNTMKAPHQMLTKSGECMCECHYE